jgi:hypothetical protein
MDVSPDNDEEIARFLNDRPTEAQCESLKIATQILARRFNMKREDIHAASETSALPFSPGGNFPIDAIRDFATLAPERETGAKELASELREQFHGDEFGTPGIIDPKFDALEF